MERQPVVPLTKKAYAKLCEHIKETNDPETAEKCISIMSNAMLSQLSFDPRVKMSRERYLKQYAQKKAKKAKLLAAAKKTPRVKKTKEETETLFSRLKKEPAPKVNLTNKSWSTLLLKKQRSA